MDDMDTYVGFSQVDHTIPDSQHTGISVSDQNIETIKAYDGYQFLQPIFKVDRWDFPTCIIQVEKILV